MYNVHEEEGVSMTIAVLAVQGAFAEHEKKLDELGISWFELRKKEDLDRHYDGLILPGGESTVQGKLLKELGMFDRLKGQIEKGLPVFATCAGLILLAAELGNDDRRWFRTLPVTVKRNAYGRQLGSFHTDTEFEEIGEIPMTFIRAPYIEAVSGHAEILATVGGNIVAAREGNQLVTAFHPELSEDVSVHKYFLESMAKNRKSA
mgnify:CR=1 FL=1